jgi:hypothetical protein
VPGLNQALAFEQRQVLLKTIPQLLVFVRVGKEDGSHAHIVGERVGGLRRGEGLHPTLNLEGVAGYRPKVDAV